MKALIPTNKFKSSPPRVNKVATRTKTKQHAPLVSILVRACNVGRFISDTLEGILQQDYQSWETIILDDASDDATEDIVKPYCQIDRRFKYVRNLHRLGRTRNLNLGLSLARGEYTCVLDGDDTWCTPHTLSSVVACLRDDPKVVVAAGNVAEINERNEIIRHFPKLWKSDHEIKNHLLVENIIAQNSVCFRTALVRNMGGYDERLSYTEDYELWLRLGRYGKIIKIPETLGGYRIHGNNIGVRKRQLQILEEIKVVWRYRHMYPHFTIAMTNRIANFIASLIPKKLRHGVALGLKYHEIKALLLSRITKQHAVTNNQTILKTLKA